MELETSLRVVEKGWGHFNTTAKERQSPKDGREGNIQTVKTGFRSRSASRNIEESDIFFTQVVEENGMGSAIIKVKTKVNIDTAVEGIFFCIDLPTKYYSNGSIRFINGSPSGKSKVNIADVKVEKNSEVEVINGRFSLPFSQPAL